MNIECNNKNQIAHPNIFTMQVKFLLSHLIVTDPSISWSQKQSPATSIPLLPAAKIIQLTIYLKWWLVAESLPTI